MVEANLEILRSKIQLIEQNLEKLEILKGLSLKDFIDDFKNTSTTRYLLQTSIESMIEIAEHIISRNRFRMPHDNADSFQVLFENKILEEKNLNSYKSMARLRNLLIHEYVEIDDSRIHSYIHSNLSDFKNFISEITMGFFHKKSK